jgi:arabinogalactan oligomer/maltooligosaccharide transport system permease protein
MAEKKRNVKRLYQESGSGSTLGLVVKIALLGIIDAMALFVLWTLFMQERWVAVVVGGLALAVVNWIYLRKGGLPAKYLAPGVIFLVAFQVYVLFFSSYTAFTNYADDHNGDIKMATSAIQASAYAASEDPADLNSGYYVCYGTDKTGAHFMFASKYDVTTDDEGNVTVSDPTTTLAGNADTLPVEYSIDEASCDGTGLSVVLPEGFEPLDPTTLDGEAMAELGKMKVYTSDAKDKFIMAEDQANGTLYVQELVFHNPGDDWSKPYFERKADGVKFLAASDGYYRIDADGDGNADMPTPGCGPESESGVDCPEKQLVGWKVEVGMQNFNKIFSDEKLRAPLLKIISWTFIFAGATVLSTFVVGLAIALLFNDERLKGKKIYRSIMILPYAFPAFLSAYVWRGLFNTRYGFINTVILGQPSGEAGVNNTPWFDNELYARIAVLLVNLWLGFPYMFLITTGALQAIPAELTESATIDGASSWQILRLIKMPLLLVSLAPLLISSFAFNFNNFTLIYLLTGGGPTDTSSTYDVGGTDILITFVYKIAFSTGHGRDYGLASAFSILIFLVIGTLSLISFRRTRTLEDMN